MVLLLQFRATEETSRNIAEIYSVDIYLFVRWINIDAF